MRVTGAIMQQNTAFNAGHQSPMLNPTYGGQMGWAPELAEWVSNQAYIRKNLVCLLIEAPAGFQYLPNPDQWVQTLKAMVELHPVSIDGLNAGLEVEVVDQPVGGGGQKHHDFTDVKETESNIVFRWTEKYGNPFQAFLRGWITYLMMDPYTKFASVTTLSGSKPTDMLADNFAATMIFIEPDPTFTHVVKSWLVTNMWPKKTGEILGKRDLTTAAEQLSLDIDFTGICQFGLGVDAFAQTLLTGINITGANPYLRAPFVSEISADVAAAAKGFATSATDTAAGGVVLPSGGAGSVTAG